MSRATGGHARGEDSIVEPPPVAQIVQRASSSSSSPHIPSADASTRHGTRPSPSTFLPIIPPPIQTIDPSGIQQQDSNLSVAFSLRRSHSLSFSLRRSHDLVWLVLFLAHLAFAGYACVLLGLHRWDDEPTSTLQIWPMFLAGVGVATAVGALLLLCLVRFTNTSVKICVHALTTYAAVISVFCFWVHQFFWGVLCGVGALLQFAYAMAVMDRISYTMLVINKAVGIISRFPALFFFMCSSVLLLAVWSALWAFGVAGVVAMEEEPLGRWWVLLLLAVSAFWTGSVVANVVHVVTADIITSWLLLDTENGQAPDPSSLNRCSSILQALKQLLLSSGSVCYGSLFTAVFHFSRWVMRGVRSFCSRNECLFCCLGCCFKLFETLVRFFNKFAYITMAVTGESFNKASFDAWELFQSTGIESLVAYDSSATVLLMAISLGGLITGTAVGFWSWWVRREQVVMVGVMAVLMGSFLVSTSLAVLESTVDTIYVIYALDPTLIGVVDPEFAAQLAEALHQRLQIQSGKHTAGQMGAMHTAPSSLPPPSISSTSLATVAPVVPVLSV